MSLAPLPALRRFLPRSLGGVGAELVVLALLIPLMAAIILPMMGADGQGKYAHWWGTSRGWRAMWVTLKLSATASAIAILLAWTLATATVRWKPDFATVVVMLSCLPLLVPSSGFAKAWIFALGLQSPVGEVLGKWGFRVYSLLGAEIVLAARYFGIAVAILTFQRVRQVRNWYPERIFRPSLVAGALHLRYRPALRAGGIALLLVMLFCINDHIIPETLLISTYGTQVMIQYGALLDLGGAAALAVPVGGVGMILLILALLIGRRLWIHTGSLSAVSAPPSGLTRRALAATLTITVLAVVLVAPVSMLISQTESVGAVVESIRDAQDQLVQTLYCAVIAGCACAVLGGVLARRWIRARRGGSLTFVPLVLLNLTVPASLVGFGVIELTQHPPLRILRDSSFPLILAYVLRFTPVSTLALYAAWRNRSELGELAGKVHGVTRWRRIWSVGWGGRRVMLAAVAVLCGLLIATELEMSILLVGTAPEIARLTGARSGATLGVRLSTLIHTAPDSMVGSLTLGVLAIICPGVILLGWLLWRARHRTGEYA